MTKVLYFWSDRKDAALALSYITFVVVFCTWVFFNMILPNPLEFMNFLNVVFRPPQLIIYVILALGQNYVSRQGYGWPTKKMKSPKERNKRLLAKNTELSWQLRFTESRLSRQVTDILFHKTVLNKILTGSCPVCLSEIEEYLEVEAYVTTGTK